MTREEAIRRIQDIERCTPIHTREDVRDFEALEMAIKALEQEPCGNAIDRAEAIKVASGYCHPANVAKELAKLPPVNPTKTGHWIEKDGFDGDVYYDCSECGESWTTIEGTPWDNEIKYCPSCGARMVEPQESEDDE